MDNPNWLNKEPTPITIGLLKLALSQLERGEYDSVGETLGLATDEDYGQEGVCAIESDFWVFCYGDIPEDFDDEEDFLDCIKGEIENVINDKRF